jgi:hypothetical protein
MGTVLPYIALSMGFVSSFHCLGMCGPIALAIPVHTNRSWIRYINYLFYNTGRACTYALLGLFVGSIAQSIQIAGYLQYLSLAIGIALMLYAVNTRLSTQWVHPPVFWVKLVGNLKKQMAVFLTSPSIGTRFLLGMLNGLLPCGMVAMALISSMATGGGWRAAIFMFLFGVATFPVMLGVSFLKAYITPRFRSAITKYTPLFLFFIGLWMIARGSIIHLPAVSASIPVCTGL